jgi:hypothetical protein
MGKRTDSIGMFWEDVEKVRISKEVIKRTPPERTWEQADYLPGLDAALAFKPDAYTNYEIGQAAARGESLLFDCEVYPNYVLFAFRSVETGKCIYFQEDTEPGGHALELGKLWYVLSSFCIINFNGRKYDFIIAAMALQGKTPEDMWIATQMIIEYNQRAKDVFKKFKIVKLAEINQIDLIELTALGPGLKVCAGRLHAKRMQDLPFMPGSYLTDDQIAITFHYCFNDLDNTEVLYKSLSEQIKVRVDTGTKYGLDLRSHSDQQMAEAIIAKEIKRITGRRLGQPTRFPPGTFFKFKTEAFIKFHTPLMNYVLAGVQNSQFFVDEIEGNIIIPPAMLAPVEIADNQYQMGLGGLHSQEKSIAYYANEDYFICDTDVTSYYPRLILNAGLAPANIGDNFLVVYDGIVVARVNAKKAGDVVLAECLKIVVNGTFGKLGSKWSVVYAPDLMLQVTVTGQLSILMLIERLELAGIRVCSANTDGIITRCLRSQEDTFYAIVRGWERETGFSTEEMRYKATFNANVNNYLAVYEKPQKGKLYKSKGWYAETSSKKNAVNEICVTAVMKLILDNVPVLTTIQACRTLSQFTSMRRAKGGAVKDGEYLGKIIRWYYSTEAQGEIVNANTGNKVARTDNAKPCMTLPEEFPADINYDWYVQETYKILEKIGHTNAAVGALQH